MYVCYIGKEKTVRAYLILKTWTMWGALIVPLCLCQIESTIAEKRAKNPFILQDSVLPNLVLVILQELQLQGLLTDWTRYRLSFITRRNNNILGSQFNIMLHHQLLGILY